MALLLLPLSLHAQYNPNSAITGSMDEPDTNQNKAPEGIVYDTGEEADSLLPGYVFSFGTMVRSVKIYALSHPSLSPTDVEMHNPAHRLDGNYYLDCGALGQIQQSLYPFSQRTMEMLCFHCASPSLQLRFQPDVSPVYRSLHPLNYFQTQRPFTHLQYGSSINKDYQIRVIHTQNIKPRWNVAFLYDLASRDGRYTNSDVTNHILDVTSNYYSEDARYQLQAAVTFNRLRQQENGGVQNDTSCWDYSRPSGVPVHMYTAQNQWRDLGVHLHQSYNTVRQFFHLRPIVETTKDSIPRDTIVGYDTIFPHQPHVYNTGVFALDLDFSKHRRIFNDNQSDSWFYNGAPTDSAFFYDSTAHYQLSAELFWTNDAYMNHRWRNPLVIRFGVRPEYDRIQFVGNNESLFSVSPFASVQFDFGRLRLLAAGEEVTGSRRNGDYRLQGNLDLLVGQSSRFHLAVCSEALSPDLFYYHNEGYYNWDYSDYNKIKKQQVALSYQLSKPDTLAGFLRNIDTRTSAMLLSDNIWINSNMQPEQGNATGLLLQATASAHLQFGWFHVRLQQMLQHSNDENVIRVPLFASKNSLFADVHIFHRALHLQTGFDLRYHTRFKADGWNPVLGAFYRQNDVEVGNYLVADFWVTLQIKRASIYAKVSHFNAPLEQHPSYFSLPHYPMEALGVYWGVIWKFFN